jgi:hypothetical protein
MPAPPDALVFPKYGNPYDIYDIDVSKFHFEFRERFRDDLLMVTVPGRVSDDDEIWKMSNKFKLGSPLPPPPPDPWAVIQAARMAALERFKSNVAAAGAAASDTTANGAPDFFILSGNPYDIYDIDVSKFHFEFQEMFMGKKIYATLPGGVDSTPYQADRLWITSNKFRALADAKYAASTLKRQAAIEALLASAATASKPAATATAPKPAATATASKPAATATASKPAATATASKPAAAAAAEAAAASAAPKPAATATAPKPAAALAVAPPAPVAEAGAEAAPALGVESKLRTIEMRGIYFDNDLETINILKGKSTHLTTVHRPALPVGMGDSPLVQVTSFILDRIAEDMSNSYNSVLKVFLDSMTPSLDITPFTEPSFIPSNIDPWVREVLTARTTQPLDAYAIFKFENVFSNCDKLLFLNDMPPTFGIIDITERMMTLSEDFYKNISVLDLLHFFVGKDRTRQLKSMFENLKRNEIHAYILVSDPNAHRCTVIFEDMCEYLGVGRKNILYCSQIDENGQLKTQLPYEIIMANFQCFARTDDGAAISFSDFAFQTSVLSSYAIPFDGRLLRTAPLASTIAKPSVVTTNEVYRNAAGLIAGVEQAAQNAEAERVEFERLQDEWAHYYRNQPRITRRLLPAGHLQNRRAHIAEAEAAAIAAEAERKKAEAITAVRTAARTAFDASVGSGGSIETAGRAAFNAARTAGMPYTERVAAQMRRNAPLNDLNRSVWWEVSTYPGFLTREAAAASSSMAAPAAPVPSAKAPAVAGNAPKPTDERPVRQTELDANSQKVMAARERKRRNEEHKAALEASARAAGRVPNIITLATGEMINLSEL